MMIHYAQQQIVIPAPAQLEIAPFIPAGKRELVEAVTIVMTATPHVTRLLPALIRTVNAQQQIVIPVIVMAPALVTFTPAAKRGPAALVITAMMVIPAVI